MRALSSLPVRLVAAAAVSLIAGCSSDPVTPPPGIQPQISNATDLFTYQITNLTNVTGTYSYTWQNTGTQAKITHSTNAGATGTATLIILDKNGTQVYSGAFASSGQPLSSVGVAGAWTIRTVYTNYSNSQVNFGVMKQ